MNRQSILALIFALITLPTFAGPGRHGPSLEATADKLGLDEYQKEQFVSIMTEQREINRAAMLSLREQGVERGSEEAKAQRKSARAQTRERLSTVLTSEQLANLEELRKKRHKHKRGKRNRADEIT